MTSTSDLCRSHSGKAAVSGTCCLCHEAVPTSRRRQHVPDTAAFPECDRHRSEVDVIRSGNRKGSLIRLPPGPIDGREKSARVLLPVRDRHLRHETRNVGVLARKDDRRQVLQTRSAQDETLGPDHQQCRLSHCPREAVRRRGRRSSSWTAPSRWTADTRPRRPCGRRRRSCRARGARSATWSSPGGRPIHGSSRPPYSIRRPIST